MNKNYIVRSQDVKLAEHELMTDKELCDCLRIHPATMRRLLKSGGKKGISSIKRVAVGSSRRWVRSSYNEFIQGKNS